MQLLLLKMMALKCPYPLSTPLSQFASFCQLSGVLLQLCMTPASRGAGCQAAATGMLQRAGAAATRRERVA
jgi:hypothetical protein